MKIAFKVLDLYENEYHIIDKECMTQKEFCPYSKDDYYGYINESNKFISCKKHTRKQPQATFIIEN